MHRLTVTGQDAAVVRDYFPINGAVNLLVQNRIEFDSPFTKHSQFNALCRLFLRASNPQFAPKWGIDNSRFAI